MVDFWKEENTFQNMHNSYFCQLLWSKVFVFAITADISVSNTFFMMNKSLNTTN